MRSVISDSWEKTRVATPTGTTSRDINPLMCMSKTVFKNGRVSIVYVMNGWNRFKASCDFMEWIEGLAGYRTVAMLPQSEAFVQAGAAESSVAEFDRSGKAAKATLVLVEAAGEAAVFRRNNRRSEACCVWTKDYLRCINVQMIKGGLAVANMFKKNAADREAEQKKIEKAIVADETADEKRTTLSLSLTASDKKALKVMAAEKETTIAAIIHEWVQEHLEEESE